jgi:uncharacterized protein (TIGR02271 family)
MERERDDSTQTGEAPALVRHEEELRGGVVDELYGSVRARKHVDTERVERVEGRAVEHGDVERLAAEEGDSGEVEELPDGSISIPLFEERLVVRKELVVRERVVIRKRVVREKQRIEADLRTERIEVEGDLEPGDEAA